MSAQFPGTAHGDQAVYNGRTLLGYIRGSIGGVYAYNANGAPIGSYADRKAASKALADRTQAREASNAEA